MEEDDKMTLKDWFYLILFVLSVFIIGFFVGYPIGRNNPTLTAKQEWLRDIDLEVQNLKQAYDDNCAEYQLGIEIRDSLINALKQELIKDGKVETPIKVSINLIDNDNE